MRARKTGEAGSWKFVSDDEQIIPDPMILKRHTAPIKRTANYLTLYPHRVYALVMNKETQKLIKRLKIIEGQVRGLQNMLTQNKYCIDVITQTSAIKNALSGVEDALMESHLSTCVVHQIKKGKEQSAISEILKVYRTKRK